MVVAAIKVALTKQFSPDPLHSTTCTALNNLLCSPQNALDSTTCTALHKMHWTPHTLCSSALHKLRCTPQSTDYISTVKNLQCRKPLSKQCTDTCIVQEKTPVQCTTHINPIENNYSAHARAPDKCSHLHIFMAVSYLAQV